MDYAYLNEKTLCFGVYDFDRFSKHDQIGEIKLPLGQFDFGKVIQESRDLSTPSIDNKV